MKKKVNAKDTLAISTHIVLPHETNTLGNLMGGELLNWMDISSAIAAQRLCRRVVVTASVNNVAFNRAIGLGEIVTIESKVSRSFNTSMEIFSIVYVEDGLTGKKIKCNEAIYTFVALDENGATVPVPELVPESDTEIERYDAALRRKQLSLILAKRMKPEDATELKALFG